MEGDPDTEEESDNDAMREEIENALYAQIHFEENTVFFENKEVGNAYDVCVEGNHLIGFKAKPTTSEIILNRSIGQDDPEEIGDSFHESKAVKKILARGCFESGQDSDIELMDLDSDIDSLFGILDGNLSDNEGIQLNVTRNQRALLQNKISAEDEWGSNRVDSRQTRNSWRYHKLHKCNNCNVEGHLSKNCPKPKKGKACGFCSELGHFMLKCPNSLCYNCDEAGHNARDCPSPKRSPFSYCSRCKMRGHDHNKCPDIWRQFHKTTTPGEFKRGKRKKQPILSCYNCAGDDHLGHECREDRMSRYVRVTLPFVCRYDSKHMTFGNDRDLTQESPTKKQKFEMNQFTQGNQAEKLKTRNKKVKSLTPYSLKVAGKEKLKSSTGRNNFDKLRVESIKSSGTKRKNNVKKAKGKGKKAKLNAVSSLNAEASYEPKGRLNNKCELSKSDVKCHVKTNTDMEDFPRGKSLGKNKNGFKFRFQDNNYSSDKNTMRDHVNWNEYPRKKHPTVNCNGFHLRFQDSSFQGGRINSSKKNQKWKGKEHVSEEMEYSSAFENHQVFKNDWWNKAGKSRKSKKKK